MPSFFSGAHSGAKTKSGGGVSGGVEGPFSSSSLTLDQLTSVARGLPLVGRSFHPGLANFCRLFCIMGFSLRHFNVRFFLFEDISTLDLKKNKTVIVLANV